MHAPTRTAAALPAPGVERRRGHSARGERARRWRHWWRRENWRAWLATIVVAAAALVTTYPLARQLIFPPAVPRYVPRDPLLRQMPVALFPVPTGRPARALILFFGNDIGFWRAHQELAERLAARGFDVVGVDVVKLLPTLPSTTPEVRDSAFAAYVRPLVRRVRREFGVLDVPLVVAGHSFGADIAIWTAAYAAPAGTVGVLAMGPGSRGHLGLSPINPLERLQNPTGPGTFSTADAVRAAAPWVRFAVVRGGGDLYAEADPALVAAGGARLHRTLVPLAGHAFRRLLIAGPLIERDVEWLLDSLAVRRPAMPPPAPARAPAS